MKASNIREGDYLVFKPARRAAYDLFERGMVVFRITQRNGYKTPWIWDEQGRAFSPSDFSHSEDITPYGDWRDHTPHFA